MSTPPRIGPTLGRERRQRLRPSRVALLLSTFGIVVSLVGAWAIGAGNELPVTKDDMRRNARRLEVDYLSQQGRLVRAEILPNALLSYTDPARFVAAGSLWAWGEAGRPKAILEVENYSHRPEATRWLHGLVSLSPGLVACTWSDGQHWKSSEPGLNLKPIPDAPTPAPTEPLRLIQMKDLSRRFAAREDGGPTERNIVLRRLSSPIHRYSDPGSGLEDGAIFVFAFGTNPEALLIIESRPSGTGTGAPVWQYSFARTTGAIVAADLDGHEVWTQPSTAFPPHTGPTYTNRWLPDHFEAK